jgi:hypothetical protein
MLGAAALLIVGFFAYVNIGAPSARAVLVLGGSVIASIVALYVVAPDAFDTRSARRLAINMILAGTLVALGYRFLLALVPLKLGPNAVYPVVAFLANALVLTLVISGLALVVARAADIERAREYMAAFAVSGVGFVLAAEATRVLDFGMTTGRWGLAPVWGLFGLYPILALPMYGTVLAVTGWGWASAERGQPVALAGALAGSVILLGMFNAAVARDPFAGFPWLFVGIGVCWWLARKTVESAAIARLPEHLRGQATP